jgi:peptidoglycan/LPS O-acetylase OafA/YrhL
VAVFILIIGWCLSELTSAAPWDPSFAWKYVNYTPLLVGGVLVLLWTFWQLSVKRWFTGPIKQVDSSGTQPAAEPA